MQPVSISRRDNVAVLTIDNPPVNVLSHAVRAGLFAALDRVDADEKVEAAIVTGAGSTFVAGADIREFGKPRSPPLVRDLAARLDAMSKPVVAAIHGVALGGGLELALGCHYRVAAVSARLGLPEVKLGLLPGGRGTQLLPRAVGPLAALRMIASGEPVSAREALELGLVDSATEHDVVEAAISLAVRMAAEGRLRRLRAEDGKLSLDPAGKASFDALAAEFAKRAGGAEAIPACIEALRGALSLPFEDGLARERELFERLESGEQSRAQRHFFFAERRSRVVPGIPADLKPRACTSVAVIGAGTMGRGIALALAEADIPTTLIDSDAGALERALRSIDTTYADAVKRGRLEAEQAPRRRERIRTATSLDAAAEADFIIEAVFEDMAVKREVVAALDRIAPPQAILATNTSYLDVDAIAAATAQPASVVGMHFFSPANVMRLVELVRGRQTSPETLATTLGLARRLGKVPVVVGVCHGFVGNRMMRQRNEEAERLLLEGALPHEVDAAMQGFGFPMGPFAAADLAGLDIGWRMRKAEGLRAEIADSLCEDGRFGQKSGRGYYRYEEGSRTPLRDPETERLIEEASARLRFERRSIDAAEIVERLTLVLVNEGARILEEGIAQRSGDIDVIWVHGYRWPVWRGGPMYHADERGLRNVADRIAHWSRHTGAARWKPAAFLTRLAAAGERFDPLDAASIA